MGNGRIILLSNSTSHNYFAPDQTIFKMQSGNKELSISSEHVIEVDGLIFRELKVQKLINNDQDLESLPKTELHHQRWIGDKTISVRQVVDEGQAGNTGEKEIQTNLTDEEQLNGFEDKWNLVWKPVLKDEDQTPN